MLVVKRTSANHTDLRRCAHPLSGLGTERQNLITGGETSANVFADADAFGVSVSSCRDSNLAFATSSCDHAAALLVTGAMVAYATCNPSEDTAAAKKKAKRSQENNNEKTREGDDEIRGLVEERRNTAQCDKHQLKDLSKRIKKCIRDRRRTNRKEKNACSESEKNDRGETITSIKGIAKCLWWILQQAEC